jgi:hypothetical protein
MVLVRAFTLSVLAEVSYSRCSSHGAVEFTDACALLTWWEEAALLPQAWKVSVASIQVPAEGETSGG